MKISYDPAKRDKVLAERDLDLGRAAEVFAGFHLSRIDVAHSAEDERRWLTVGALDDVVVIVVWTDRGDERRIVTMWKANGKERTTYQHQREQYG